MDSEICSWNWTCDPINKILIENECEGSIHFEFTCEVKKKQLLNAMVMES